MNIQWYPGHMTKAKRAMEADIRAVDLIIELVDARAPLATRNPDIGKLGKEKERVIVMNKADLAEEAVSADWCAWFRQRGIRCLLMDSRSRKHRDELLCLVERACLSKRERDRKRGMLNRPVRAMVAGIPNVGKSTLINTIAGKSAAKTGNRPGVTKGNQWIRLNRSIELLDTPGILCPKFEDRHVATCIAFLGSIHELITDPQELAAALLSELEKKGKLEGFLSRFSLEQAESPNTMLDMAALNRGCLVAGGLPNREKISGIILNEFRSGRFGRISLEMPKAEEV